jgi:hypothetical protein
MPPLGVIQSFAMRKALALFLMFFAGVAADRFLAPAPARAQSEKAATLTIGDVPLTLGMPKAEALKRLSAYAVGSASPGGKSIIATKNVFRDGVNHFSILGSIEFYNDTVIEISRDWGDGENGPEVERLWRSLWGAISSSIASGGGYVPASLRTHMDASPDGQFQVIDVLVGANHLVSIQRSDITSSRITPSGAVWSVSVDETVAKIP